MFTFDQASVSNYNGSLLFDDVLLGGTGRSLLRFDAKDIVDITREVLFDLL